MLGHDANEGPVSHPDIPRRQRRSRPRRWCGSTAVVAGHPGCWAMNANEGPVSLPDIPRRQRSSRAVVTEPNATTDRAAQGNRWIERWTRDDDVLGTAKPQRAAEPGGPDRALDDLVNGGIPAEFRRSRGRVDRRVHGSPGRSWVRQQ